MYGLYTHLFISVCVGKTCKHSSNKSNYTGNKKALLVEIVTENIHFERGQSRRESV